MGREVKRVVAGFDWPLSKVWEGFLQPDWLDADPCPACEHGLSADGKRLHDEWYGYRDFDPKSTGSAPFTVDTAEVRAFAERNIANAPDYYGSGEDAVVREAERLLKHWNSMWMHHLAQEDVDALIEDGRLWDFTRVFIPGTGWQDRDEPYRPTAREVNLWSLRGFGHDSLNAHIVIRARCEREGLSYTCGVCGGSGSRERFVGQAQIAENWECIEPPAGEWWQIWETVSEGSPVTPAFETPEELAEYWAGNRGGSAESALAWITNGGWAPTLIASSAGVQTAEDIITKGGAS